MKNFLFTAFVLYSAFCFSQSEYNYSYDYHYNYNDYLVGQIPPQKNQEIDIEVTRVKSGKTRTYHRSYDAYTNLVRSSITKNGKTKPLQTNTFNKEGKVLSRKHYSNGKLDKTYTFERDEINRITSFTKERKGKLKRYNTYTYQPGERGCYLKSVAYKKNNETVYRVWDYEYYDNACDKKKSTLRNGKGKILKEWTYDCKQEGEELMKKKDVTQVCKWEEGEGEFLKRVYQTFDEKGRIHTSTFLYRKSDTILVSLIKKFGYGARYEITYDPNIKKELTNSFFNKKGRLVYKWTYEYEAAKLVKTEYVRNDKLKSASKYNYNEDDELIAYKSFGKGNKLIHSSVLTYK